MYEKNKTIKCILHITIYDQKYKVSTHFKRPRAHAYVYRVFGTKSPVLKIRQKKAP